MNVQNDLLMTFQITLWLVFLDSSPKLKLRNISLETNQLSNRNKNLIFL